MNKIEDLSVKFIHKFQGSSTRSRQALKNMLLSLMAKSISLIVPILIVPLTINYVNPTQYGIWLTISSLITWISVFDLGLGNGLRNRLAECIAKGNNELARQYISTTYFIITLIVTILYVLILIANSFVDWSSVLKIDSIYSEELQKVVGIVSLFFCISMIMGIFTSILSGNQENGKASLISGLGQIGSLLSIFILTKISTGSLVNLALYFSGVPCIVTLIVSLIAFAFTKYRRFAPSFKLIRLKLIKDVLNLGVQFFLIHICMIAIFQVINFILSREIGPIAVTQYNIASKYFGIITTISIIVMTPFWSAFTDAFTKKDYVWMKNVAKKMELTFLIYVILGVIMLVISPFVYKIWIKDSVEMPLSLSLAMMIYVLTQALENIYVYLINGIGTIRLQLVIYVLFALISWPTLTYACRTWGVYGALFVPSLTFLIQAMFGKVQLKKILANRANGIWGK